MKAVHLTTDDPLYLPEFYDWLLRDQHADTLAVFVVPPLYKQQTPLDAAWRYLRTFGAWDTFRLVMRIVGAKLRRRSIAAACARWNVRCEEIADVNAPAFLETLRALGPDVLVSVSCPQIFKPPLIELAPRGVLNIHGAILPHYRGVLPSFWMLANGERQAGVSIYFVNEQIDAGDLCGVRVFDIRPEDSLDSFLIRSKQLAAELLIDILGAMNGGTVPRQPLNLAEGSYFAWPDREAVQRFRARGRSVW